jgi:hypothetical protein
MQPSSHPKLRRKDRFSLTKNTKVHSTRTLAGKVHPWYTKSVLYELPLGGKLSPQATDEGATRSGRLIAAPTWLNRGFSISVGATPVYGHPYGSFVADGCLTLRSPGGTAATLRKPPTRGTQRHAFGPMRTSAPTQNAKLDFPVLYELPLGGEAVAAGD